MSVERVVVIAGATGLLGSVVAQKFAAGGSRLALLGTNQARLDQLVGDLHMPGEKVVTSIADLIQPGGANLALQLVMDRFGRVDVLLNLIGGWRGGKAIAEVTQDDIVGMLDQHVWTTFFLLKSFLPQMQKQGWGRVIVVSSASVGFPPGNNLPYLVAKSGQEAMILTAAEELRSTGITANILRVQTIDTQHVREKSPSEQNAAWTTPEEIAAAIEYLVSDSAGVVNGARIPMYGSA